MRYRVNHTTIYEYTAPVSLCQNLVHLTPRDVPHQTRRRSEMTIAPLPQVLTERVDFYGNPATFFAIQTPHRRLSVSASHIVQVSPRSMPLQTEPWEQVRLQLATDLTPAVRDACQYVFDSRYASTSDDLAAYAQPSFSPGRPFLDALLDLTRRIHHDFKYDPRATTIATPLSEVFAGRRGVCQDFAHLQIACLRSLGLAARYVSGYLVTNPPPGQARLIGADASHAWLSAFSPAAGWIDVDPTNNQIPSDKHILLGWGLDYDDVSPVKGVILGGGQHVVKVAVDVQHCPDDSLSAE